MSGGPSWTARESGGGWRWRQPQSLGTPLPFSSSGPIYGTLLYRYVHRTEQTHSASPVLLEPTYTRLILCRSIYLSSFLCYVPFFSFILHSLLLYFTLLLLCPSLLYSTLLLLYSTTLLCSTVVYSILSTEFETNSIPFPYIFQCGKWVFILHYRTMLFLLAMKADCCCGTLTGRRSSPTLSLWMPATLPFSL